MIGFNKPYLVGKELTYIKQAYEFGQFAGDGFFTKKCSHWLETHTGSPKVLLTHSCTAALEMAAILANIKPGDEIIMPSFTFVSTANAFVLRGGIPVFVDIRKDTLNIDETLIESAITSRTKAIVAVHYAGVSCEMDIIVDIARRYNLLVIEDAAQGIMSRYKGKALGSIGDLGCYSFHETKNIISGEGGALLINNNSLIERAEIIREKGTNRSNYFRGKVDKYSWVDIGSSFLPGEITAAFLWAQLEAANYINSARKKIWKTYFEMLVERNIQTVCILPEIPENCLHNGHMFFLITKNFGERSKFIEYMHKNGINCVFHYVPLHSSFFGSKNSKISGSMKNTNNYSDRIVRLPIWIGIDEKIEAISNKIYSFYRN